MSSEPSKRPREQTMAGATGAGAHAPQRRAHRVVSRSGSGQGVMTRGSGWRRRPSVSGSGVGQEVAVGDDAERPMVLHDDGGATGARRIASIAARRRPRARA